MVVLTLTKEEIKMTTTVHISASPMDGMAVDVMVFTPAVEATEIEVASEEIVHETRRIETNTTPEVFYVHDSQDLRISEVNLANEADTAVGEAEQG